MRERDCSEIQLWAVISGRPEASRNIGGCDMRLAQRIGAELAITGTVQKVSGTAAGGSTFAIVLPTARLVMSWSDANAKYRWYTPSSLAVVRRAE
jgi:hypothetical protein